VLTIKERKAEFERYLRMRVQEEKKEKAAKIKEARDNFKAWLDALPLGPKMEFPDFTQKVRWSCGKQIMRVGLIAGFRNGAIVPRNMHPGFERYIVLTGYPALQYAKAAEFKLLNTMKEREAMFNEHMEKRCVPQIPIRGGNGSWQRHPDIVDCAAKHTTETERRLHCIIPCVG
jgi:hypothetical protein